MTFIPPAAVAAEARRGLELRASQPPSNRCCTPVGLRRASQLANRQPVSVNTLKRMKAYFDRHAIDKQGKGWAEGTSKGMQAWLAWGGDSARVWCNEVLASIAGAGHNPRGFSQKGEAMAGKTKAKATKKRNPSADVHAKHYAELMQDGMGARADAEDREGARGKNDTSRALYALALERAYAAGREAKYAGMDKRYAEGAEVLEDNAMRGIMRNPGKSKSKKRNPSAAAHNASGYLEEIVKIARKNGLDPYGFDSDSVQWAILHPESALQSRSRGEAQIGKLMLEAKAAGLGDKVIDCYVSESYKQQNLAKNPKSKSKKRNPSAAEHEKRGREVLALGQSALQTAKRTGQKFDYLTAYTDGVEAELDAYYAMDKATEKGARQIMREASGNLLKNPGKRLHNFKVLDAKGKALALTTTLAEANKCCPKGGKVVAL